MELTKIETVGFQAHCSLEARLSARSNVHPFSLLCSNALVIKQYKVDAVS